jgi:hypothetical protein
MQHTRVEQFLYIGMCVCMYVCMYVLPHVQVYGCRDVCMNEWCICRDVCMNEWCICRDVCMNEWCICDIPEWNSFGIYVCMYV